MPDRTEGKLIQTDGMVERKSRQMPDTSNRWISPRNGILKDDPPVLHVRMPTPNAARTLTFEH